MQFMMQNRQDGNRYAVLNTDGLDIPNRDKQEGLYIFPLKAYSKFKGKTDDGVIDENSAWTSVFGYINIFFNTLTPVEQQKVAITYAIIHNDVNVYCAQNNLYKTSELISTISSRLIDLDNEIDLCRKMHRFVIESGTIKIGIMENAGSRPQDSKELTFHDDEVMLVATLALMCKMFCPIFGLLISVLSSSLSSTLQDVHCSGILKDIINAHSNEFESNTNLKAVTEKLKHYIEHQTAQICRNDIDTSIVAGYDVHNLAYSLYCRLLVRKLVGISLTNRESNIMAFIVVYVRNCTRQILSNTKAKQPTMLREDKETESEDGNTARLETDSMTSTKTADIDSLIAACVQPAVNRVMSIYGISSEEIDTCIAWHNSHPIIPNSINKQLNSLQYGKDFGGSLGIQMLLRDDFSLITVLLQLILLHHTEMIGNENEKRIFSSLVHLITAYPTDSKAISGMNIDMMFAQTGGSPHYQKCKENFQNSTVTNKDKAWENHIKKLIEDILFKHYVYNSSPYVWEVLGQENMNGKIIPIDANVFIAYCFYYNWELENREQLRKLVGS